jgi:hypothetical protein
MKIPVKEFRLVPNGPHESPQVEKHSDGLGTYYTVRVGREVISSHKTQALAENAARHVLGERAAHYVEPPRQNSPGIKYRDHTIFKIPGGWFGVYTPYSRKMQIQEKSLEKAKAAVDKQWAMFPKQSVPAKNPRRGRTLIYSDIIAIIASKANMDHNCDAKCKKSAHKYIHKFKPGSCVWGLPSGNVEVGK